MAHSASNIPTTACAHSDMGGLSRHRAELEMEDARQPLAKDFALAIL